MPEAAETIDEAPFAFDKNTWDRSLQDAKNALFYKPAEFQSAMSRASALLMDLAHESKNPHILSMAFLTYAASQRPVVTPSEYRSMAGYVEEVMFARSAAGDADTAKALLQTRDTYKAQGDDSRYQMSFVNPFGQHGPAKP